MTTMSRWLTPAALAVALGFGAMAPAHAQSSQNDLVRVLVDVADVVFRGSTPYYRQGDYSNDDRLVVQRDRYGRPVYYRSVPRSQHYGRSVGDNDYYGYSKGRDYNDRDYNDSNRRVKCNKHGKCKVEYYDPRYDREGRNNNARYDRNGRYWDGRQWRNGDNQISSRYRDDDD